MQKKIFPIKNSLLITSRYYLSIHALLIFSFLYSQGNINAETELITTKNVSISAEDISSFEKASDSLYKQTGFVIVAEDTPLSKALSPQKAIQNASSKEALQHLAESFDYSFDTIQNVVYLKKRFSNSQDLPCVTSKECLTSLQNVQKILDQFNPQFIPRRTPTENDPLIDKFAGSLNTDQLQALKGDGLALQTLSPEQKTQAERFAFYIYDQTNLQDIKNILFELEHIENAELCYGDFDDKRQFGYLLPFNSDKKSFLAFSRHYSMPVVVGPSATALESNTDSNSKNLSSEVPGSPEDYSLETLVSQINSTNPKSEKHYAVDAELAAKHVTIIGLSKASPEIIMAAVARIYGLRLVETKEANHILVTLSSQQRRNPATINEIDSALRRVLPDPLVRILSETDSPAVPQPATPTNGNLTEYLKQLRAKQESRRKRDAFASNLRQTAGSELEQAFLRYLKDKKASDKDRTALPFSSLNEREKNIFALALMTPALDALQRNFLKPPPAYLARQDQVILKGGPYVDKQGNNMFRLHFYLPDRNGKPTLQTGINGMTYNPK